MALPYVPAPALKARYLLKAEDAARACSITGRQAKKAIELARRRAVRKAWRQERDLLRRTGRGTREWTEQEIAELLTAGKVKGYQGHHINNVANHPGLAGDPRNIEFVQGAGEHLSRHGGNWKNPTVGDLLER